MPTERAEPTGRRFASSLRTAAVCPAGPTHTELAARCSHRLGRDTQRDHRRISDDDEIPPGERSAGCQGSTRVTRSLPTPTAAPNGPTELVPQPAQTPLGVAPTVVRPPRDRDYDINPGLCEFVEPPSVTRPCPRSSSCRARLPGQTVKDLKPSPRRRWLRSHRPAAGTGSIARPAAPATVVQLACRQPRRRASAAGRQSQRLRA